MLRQIQNGLRYVFQTHNKYTFALTGSATCAMETSILNLLSPSQKFLSLVHGHWGERAAQMAERLNHKVYRLNISQTGDIFSLAQIEGWLKSNNQIKCNLFVFFF